MCTKQRPAVSNPIGSVSGQRSVVSGQRSAAFVCAKSPQWMTAWPSVKSIYSPTRRPFPRGGGPWRVCYAGGGGSWARRANMEHEHLATHEDDNMKLHNRKLMKMYQHRTRARFSQRKGSGVSAVLVGERLRRGRRRQRRLGCSSSGCALVLRRFLLLDSWLLRRLVLLGARDGAAVPLEAVIAPTVLEFPRNNADMGSESNSTFPTSGTKCFVAIETVGGHVKFFVETNSTVFPAMVRDAQEELGRQRVHVERSNRVKSAFLDNYLQK